MVAARSIARSSALIAASVTLSMLAACQDKPHMLGIKGYNYTGRYIDTFSVNSQGGGNLGANDIGSGTVCCISLHPDQELPVTIHVEWTYGYKLDKKTGEIAIPDEQHEMDVQLKGPMPKSPSTFVVHFFPNNTVEVEVADALTDPAVRMSPNKEKK